jgi:trigger factor
MSEEQEATTVKNTVTIESTGPCKKKVIVEIPRERIQKATDEQYETFRKDVILPGFRKGRAPRRLLEKRFGKEATEQIKLKLLADASDAAIKENKIDFLREPDIDYEKVELPADGPMKFDFEVEVRPEFELPSLEGISVKKRKIEVTDEQISGEIEQLRKWSGVWAPREDGKAEPNDQVVGDVVLNVEGVEQPQRQEYIEIYIRHNGFVADVPVENLDEIGRAHV